MTELRKPKGRGGIGCPRDPAYPYKKLKSESKLKTHGDTKRAREEVVFRLLRKVIIQETAMATGISEEVLNEYHADHIFGRDASGFEPLGAMLSPLNIQMLPSSIHLEKTNAVTKEGQRFDYRDTLTQERLVELNRRLINKVGRVFTLVELRKAIKDEFYRR